MASPTSRCAILLLSLLSLLFADTAALRLGAAASHPRRARLYLSLPRELLALNVIPAAVAEAESTAENWAALRECFPTEAEALAAVEKNPATLLPYGFDSENRAENIRGSYSVLQDVLESEAEVQDAVNLLLSPEGERELSTRFNVRAGAVSGRRADGYYIRRTRVPEILYYDDSTGIAIP